MASPFVWFRKQQKVMLAVFGVVLMVAFVILPSTCQSDGAAAQRARSQDAVVVETKYGEMRRSELAHLGTIRHSANVFVSRLAGQAMGRLQEAMRELQQSPNTADMAGYFRQYQELDTEARMIQFLVSNEGFGGGTSDRETVYSMILAKRGEELGVQITTESLNAFIREVSRHRVSSDEIRDIIKSMGVPEQQIFEGMRHEMLAARVLRIFYSALPGPSAAGRWDWYQMLQRKVSVAVLPVSVEDEVNNVANPTSADENDLVALYDKHKDEVKHPDLPIPGFRQPHRAEFDYVSANVEDFIDENALKPEELQEYYDKHRDLFRYDPSLDDKPLPTAPPAEAKDDDAKTPAEKTPAEKTPPVTNPEKTAPAPEVKTPAAPVESKTPAKTDLKTEGGGGPGDPPAADPAAPAKTDATTPPEKTPAEKTPAAKTDEPLSTPPVVGDKPASEKKPEPKVIGVSPTSTESSLLDWGPEQQYLELSLRTSITKYLVPRAIKDAINIEFKPFWFVEKDVRKNLARERGEKALQTEFDAIAAAMKKYGDAQLKAGRLNDKYTFDLSAQFVGKPKIKLGELTGMLSDLELVRRVSGLGKSQVSSGEGFANFAYRQLPLLVPTRSQDVGGAHYLFWKTREQQAYRPEFKDIRAQVVHEWKLEKARAAVQKKAETFAAEIRAKDGLAMTSSIPWSWAGKIKPIEVKDFTALKRLTASNPDQRAQVRFNNDVKELDRAGWDVMRATYRLDLLEVGVAFNEPKNICYVIQLIGVDPRPENLRPLFFNTSFSSYSDVMSYDRDDLFISWRAKFFEDAKLKWVNASGGDDEAAAEE